MQGVQFDSDSEVSFEKSWSKSVAETCSLFDKIGTLKPHHISSTINLNEARRIIVAMSRPLATVAKIIQQNVDTAKKAEKESKNIDKEMVDLQKRQLTGYNIKRIELPSRRTVCTHESCVKRIFVGKGKYQDTVYETVCHDNCSRDGFPTETINDEQLKDCAGIVGVYSSMSKEEKKRRRTDPNRGNECDHCGHSYKIHMHITYRLEMFEEKFFTKEVRDLINEQKTLKDKKEVFRRQLAKKTLDLENETTIILQTSAKYGSFLQANVLIPYNDAVGDYLDLFIHQEKTNPDAEERSARTASLTDMKEEYLHQKDLLDKAIGKNTDNSITTQDIAKLQATLFELTYMGPKLRELFVDISFSNQAKNVRFIETVAPIQSKSIRKAKDKWDHYWGH